MTNCEYKGCDNPKITTRKGTGICYDCLDRATTCSIWKCENRVKQGYAYCKEHPPLVDHGLSANDVECPECGEQGAGTIHDDLWYCLNDYGFTGCGHLFDPYEVANVDKERKW